MTEAAHAQRIFPRRLLRRPQPFSRVTSGFTLPIPGLLLSPASWVGTSHRQVRHHDTAVSHGRSSHRLVPRLLRRAPRPAPLCARTPALRPPHAGDAEREAGGAAPGRASPRNLRRTLRPLRGYASALGPGLKPGTRARVTDLTPTVHPSSLFRSLFHRQVVVAQVFGPGFVTRRRGGAWTSTPPLAMGRPTSTRDPAP